MKSIDCCFLRWHILAHTHTCEVVLIYLYPVFEPLFSFWFVSGSFTLIHVIYQSSALSLSFWTGKKQGAPENRNKGNPPPPPSLPIQRQVLESRVNLTHSPLSLSRFLPRCRFDSLPAEPMGASSRLALPVKECNSHLLQSWALSYTTP